MVNAYRISDNALDLRNDGSADDRHNEAIIFVFVAVVVLAALPFLTPWVIAAMNTSRELKDGYAFRVDPAQASIVDIGKWLDL